MTAKRPSTIPRCASGNGYHAFLLVEANSLEAAIASRFVTAAIGSSRLRVLGEGVDDSFGIRVAGEKVAVNRCKFGRIEGTWEVRSSVGHPRAMDVAVEYEAADHEQTDTDIQRCRRMGESENVTA